MRYHAGLVWALNLVTGALKRDRKGDTQTQEKPRKSHVKTEAEMEWCVYKPRDAWSHQKLEEAGKIIPKSLQKEPTL